MAAVKVVCTVALGRMLKAEGEGALLCRGRRDQWCLRKLDLRVFEMSGAPTNVDMRLVSLELR